jgi:hypothetical protein
MNVECEGRGRRVLGMKGVASLGHHLMSRPCGREIGFDEIKEEVPPTGSKPESRSPFPMNRGCKSMATVDPPPASS